MSITVCAILISLIMMIFFAVNMNKLLRINNNVNSENNIINPQNNDMNSETELATINFLIEVKKLTENKEIIWQEKQRRSYEAIYKFWKLQYLDCYAHDYRTVLVYDKISHQRVLLALTPSTVELYKELYDTVRLLYPFKSDLEQQKTQQLFMQYAKK